MRPFHLHNGSEEALIDAHRVRVKDYLEQSGETESEFQVHPGAKLRHLLFKPGMHGKRMRRMMRRMRRIRWRGRRIEEERRRNERVDKMGCKRGNDFLRDRIVHDEWSTVKYEGSWVWEGHKVQKDEQTE